MLASQGALEDYRAGMAITQRLAAADPSNAMWRNDVEVSRRMVARLRNIQE
jgi:hypothetical protein